VNVDPFVSAIAGMPPMSLGGVTANMGAPFGSLAQSVPSGSAWSVITQ
jgi:hypothetical protein